MISSQFEKGHSDWQSGEEKLSSVQVLHTETLFCLVRFVKDLF